MPQLRSDSRAHRQASKHTDDRVREFIWAAEAGLPLIPIRSDDARPLRAGWQRLATTNLAKVHDWATRHEAMAVATGRSCDVFDIEVEHVGLVGELIESNRGPVARSARGGVHLYTQPTGLGCPRLVLNGVHVGELKGKGGTCTVPPSVRSKGTYSWLRAPWEAPLLPAGPALSALVQARRPDIEPGAWQAFPSTVADLDRLGQVVAHARPGERNSILFWAACRALAEGSTPAAVEAALGSAAKAAGLGLDEIRTTLGSAAKTVGAP